MTNPAFNLFLLFTTLSQLKDRQRTIDLFIQSISAMIPGGSVRWGNQQTGSQQTGTRPLVIEVCSRTGNYGYVSIEVPDKADAALVPLIENACQMLAVILEKQEQERFLTDQNLHLEALVAERTQYLQQKTTELDNYFSYALELFCIADLDGYFRRLNKQWEAALGYTLEELEGKQFWEFIHPDDITKTRQAVMVLTTGHSVTGLTNRYRHRNGSYRLIEWRSFPQGNQIFAAARDITDKQKTEESLMRAQRLESIGVLAGGIAHDFNNLLGGMFGFLDLARDSLTHEDVKNAQDCIDQAIHAFNRAKALTRQLLTFSKGGEPVLQVTQLDNVIRQNVAFALSGSNVQSEFFIDSDLWLCNCDENQFGQVIDNLIINAKLAMPGGGRVQIRANNLKTANPSGAVGDFIHIQISDTGTGIPAELLPRIFDPFFSTRAEGHGLGLSTAYSIIQRHNGWMDVESVKGNGTTFHIFLPSIEHVDKTFPKPQHANVRHEGSGIVIVMDDEPLLRDVLSQILERMGYVVLTARNGDETLSILAHQLHQNIVPCAYILDLTIPGGKGGAETATEIRKMHPDAKLIAMSGYAENAIMANPTQFGFSGRLSKPFRQKDITQLLSAKGESSP
jgi:PAS domain S-box-containing protein